MILIGGPMKTFVLSLVSLFVGSTTALAGFEGSISFTDSERNAHIAQIDTIVTTAVECLQADLAFHQTFFAENGFSPFYGDQSSFSKKSTAGKKAELSALGRADYVSKMQPTSCIGLTSKCLGKGFAEVGQADVWKRLKAFTDLNGADGSALQKGLRDLGWRVLYWNPDTERNVYWDDDEKKKHPGDPKHIWGYHEERWQSVKNGGRYLYNVVDDYSTLVNFHQTPPQSFQQIPFFVGIAHGGYHVFPGYYGSVIEGHSTRQITDPQTVEQSEFNPLVKGGGPRGDYRSGLIAVPPGY
jgi:hypothetical protein